MVSSSWTSRAYAQGHSCDVHRLPPHEMCVGIHELFLVLVRIILSVLILKMYPCCLPYHAVPVFVKSLAVMMFPTQSSPSSEAF